MTVETWSTAPPAPSVGLAMSATDDDVAKTHVADPMAHRSTPLTAVLGPLGAFVPRPFATEPSDLAIDLTDPVTPAAVTEILRTCLRDATGAPPTAELLRGTPVGDRIAALMAVAAAAGDGTFSATDRCSNDGCGEGLELEITWDEIRTLAKATAREPFAVGADGLTFVVRRPDAADQEGWTRISANGTEITPRALVAGLVVDGPTTELTPARIARIEAALDERDPLICFTVGIGCPTCGSINNREISLVAIGAAVLRRRQARMLDDVHDLARAYGWHEAEILAIPAWRRAYYRGRIAADR